MNSKMVVVMVGPLKYSFEFDLLTSPLFASNSSTGPFKFLELTDFYK